jgi:hypothetical protein
MSNILIKEVDTGLLREINKAAIDAEQTQREWILGVVVEKLGLRTATGIEQLRKEVASKISRPKREVNGQVDGGGTVEETTIEPTEARPKKGKGVCPDCELPMRDWGKVWRCQHCRKEVKK